MKGIVLAGGSGTRLYPITRGVCKQLLPVYDKPMIYYPISVLMLAGIRDIMVITNPDDARQFENLLGDGSEWGISLTYATQSKPNGIAEALIIGEEFIADDNVTLILGDNLFYGYGLQGILENTISQFKTGATVFGYHVADPERFGVLSFNASGVVTKIEEKPTQPESSIAVTGLYVYDQDAASIAKAVKPSARQEKEITAVNEVYLERGQLQVTQLGRGHTWLDMGTYDSMLEAAHFVSIIEQRQGYKVACLEEIAWRNAWLSDQAILAKAKQYHKNSYGSYLQSLIS